jgi:hypothetical protein
VRPTAPAYPLAHPAARAVVVYSRSYTGSGKKQGAIGYESGGHAALPEASRQALRQAVDAAVSDLERFIKTCQLPTDQLQT